MIRVPDLPMWIDFAPFILIFVLAAVDAIRNKTNHQ